MKMRQVLLRQQYGETYDKSSWLTCWLPLDRRLKHGALVTLEIDGFEKPWEVVRSYAQIVEKDQLWKPWKVGGM
jgi:hypothetical protein